MLKEIFRAIPGINIFPLISLILFFTIFVIVTIWILRVKESYIKKMEELPLDDNSDHFDNGEN